MTEYQQKKKGLSFQGIIWETLKSLREKTGQEYRTPQKKVLIHGNWSETIIEGDSRCEVIQLIDYLSDILFQEFDKDTLKKYTAIQGAIKKKRDLTNTGKFNPDDYTSFKLEKMRELLRVLMILIKEKNYLKGLGETGKEEHE